MKRSDGQIDARLRAFFENGAKKETKSKPIARQHETVKSALLVT